MRRLCLYLLCAIPLSYGTSVAAQPAPAIRTFENLQRTVPRIAAPAGLQLRLRWQTDLTVADPRRTRNQFDVVWARPLNLQVRPERAPEVAGATLALVSVSADGQELDWRVIRDPRVVRSELADDDTLKSDKLYYRDISFTLLLPDTPGLAGLHIYTVHTLDGQLMASPLGTVVVGRGK